MLPSSGIQLGVVVLKYLAINMEKYLVAYLDKLAEEGGTSRSAIIRNIVRDTGVHEDRSNNKDTIQTRSRYKGSMPGPFQELL